MLYKICVNGGKEMDGMLELCIKQGYVPKDCKLDGDLVFALISSGNNPCDGCNAICPHRIKRGETHGNKN